MAGPFVVRNPRRGNGETVESIVQSATALIAAHAAWAGPLMFIVAFGESLAFLSLLFPGTAILLAAGALVPSGALPLWPLLAGAIAGAIMGDAVSYWLARRYGHALERVWPFTRRPDLIPRGIAFFQRHGGKSVFIGRFFGPMRAVIPLAAGLLRMPAGRFWLANIASAVVWAPGVLFPGAALGLGAEQLVHGEQLLPIALLGLVALGIAGIWLACRRMR